MDLLNLRYRFRRVRKARAEQPPESSQVDLESRFAVPCHSSSHSFWCMSDSQITYLMYVYIFDTTWCVDFVSRIVLRSKGTETAHKLLPGANGTPAPYTWWWGRCGMKTDQRKRSLRTVDHWSHIPTKRLDFMKQRKEEEIATLCLVQSNVLSFTAWHRRFTESSTSRWQSSRRGPNTIFALQKVKHKLQIKKLIFSFSFWDFFKISKTSYNFTTAARPLKRTWPNVSVQQVVSRSQTWKMW